MYQSALVLLKQKSRPEKDQRLTQNAMYESHNMLWRSTNKQKRFSSIRVIVPPIQAQRLSLEARESSSSASIKDSEEPVSDALDRQPNGHDSSREMSIPFGPLETEDSESCLSVHSKKDSIHDLRTIRCICGATEANQDDGKELIACNQCKISQHTACVKYLCQECTKCAQQTVAEPPTRSSVPQIDSSTETDDLVDPQLQFAVDIIQELEGSLADKERELQESRQKVADLEQDIHFLNEARKQRDEQNGPSVEEHIERLQKQVHNLNIDLRARHRLGTFTKLTPESRYQGVWIDIKSSFDYVYHSNNMIFRGMEIEEFPFIPQLQFHKRLLGLAEFIAGSQVDSVAQLQEGYFLSINPVVLLRSLATAALQRWVFETDFPSFASDSSTTLAVYRDLLVRQGIRGAILKLGTEGLTCTADGALALRNLDLAAFEAKLGKPEFLTSLLPKQAQKLAVRLLQTLAPFFTRNPQHLDELSYISFADWGDEIETWKERQEVLVKVFTEALTTKANSCLNIEDYEMVMYAPGTKFDAKSMEAEKMDGTADISDPDGRVIQICIQAAVFVYARSPVQNDASVSNSIIPSRNFVRKAEHERGIPRVKAFVVLADGN